MRGPDAIWEYRLDGRRRGRVTRRWPAVGWNEWSRDGRTLAYERIDTERNIEEIRLVDRGRRRDGRLVAGRLPRWSPNGRRIAYQHANDVWTVRRDGRGRRRLVDNDPEGAIAGWDDWSPDGRLLVSRGVAPRGDPFGPRLQLRFVRFDGRRERRLTLPAQVNTRTRSPGSLDTERARAPSPPACTPACRAKIKKRTIFVSMTSNDN